jgi:hypothetical protein
VGLEVSDFGDDLEVVVDGVGIDAVCLPVFGTGDYPAVLAPVLVTDGSAAVVTPRRVDRVDAPIAAVVKRVGSPASRCARVWRAMTRSLRLPGRQPSTATTRRAWAQTMIWVLTLRR